MLSSLPMIYVVPALSRVTVPANDAIEVQYFWPSMREATGLIVLPADGSPTTLAGLSLGILDSNDEQVFSDQIGNTQAGREPFTVGCLALVGRGLHPFPLQRVVEAGERWLLTLRNMTGAGIDVASLAFHARAVE